MAVTKITAQEAKAMMGDSEIKAVPQEEKTPPLASSGSGKFTWKTVAAPEAEEGVQLEDAPTGDMDTPPWDDADLGVVKELSHTEANAVETKKMPHQLEEVEEYAIKSGPDVIPAHELANVNVSLGLTLNLGDFNIAKVGVSVTMPTNVKDLDASYQFAKEWAEDRIATMAGEVKQGE